jgi:hypothetical protein
MISLDRDDLTWTAFAAARERAFGRLRAACEVARLEQALALAAPEDGRRAASRQAGPPPAHPGGTP